jgi:putative MATE family efflux protein
MPIGRLLARLAIPGSLALFVSSTYNLVDTIFVGRGVGFQAIGALTLIFPFQMVVMAFGNLIGIGAASVISRNLGAGNLGRARSTAGTAVSLAISLGLVMTLLGSFFSIGLAGILGAGDELRAPTLDYLRVILIAVPLQILNIAANSIIRAEGQAKVAMGTLAAGMLLNIGLDPVFIFVLGWGIRGAAIATVIGHSLTTLLIVGFYVRGRGSVRLRWSDLRPQVSVVQETVKIGSSGFVRQVSTSFVQGLRNNLLVIYGGTVFISAFGVVFRSMLFLAMPAMGIPRLFSLDPELIQRGIPIMRINAIGMLAFPASFIGPSFYQAVGKPMKAMVLALARPILAVVIMLIGVRMVGPLGPWQLTQSPSWRRP